MSLRENSIRLVASTVALFTLAWLTGARGALLAQYAPLQADPYEPNDTFSESYGPMVSNAAYRGAIWPASDADYFHLDIAEVGWLEVLVEGDNSSGSIEVFNEIDRVYPFARAGFSPDSQARIVRRLPPGRFWVVIARSGTLNRAAPYALRVFVPGQATATPSRPTPTPGVDKQEPNDAFAQAFGPIVPGVIYRGRIDPALDHDFFVLRIVAEGDLEVVVDQATFDGQVELFNDVNQDRAFESDTFTPSSSARVSRRLPPGIFWILITRSYGGATTARDYRVRAYFPAAPTATATPRPTATTPGYMLPVKAFAPLAVKRRGPAERASPIPTKAPTMTRRPTASASPTVRSTATAVRTMTPTAVRTATKTRTPSTTPRSTTATATLAVTAPSATGTPTQTPSVTPSSGARFRIAALQCEGRDEYVQVTNEGSGGGNLAGWDIYSTEGAQRFSFPSRAMAAGESVYVHSGPDAPPAGGRNMLWTSSYIWNNQGDTAQLQDPSGSVVDEADC